VRAAGSAATQGDGEHAGHGDEPIGQFLQPSSVTTL